MEFLIATPGLPESTFTNIFGEEGKLMYKVYQEGKDVMEFILKDKQKLLTTPDEGASEAEKRLYGLSLELLNAYIEGALSNELINYYKEKMEDLNLYSH